MMKNIINTPLFVHGVLSLALGLLGGFVLLLQLFFNIPLDLLSQFFELQILGSSSAWRPLYAGLFFSGILVIFFGISLGALGLTPRQEGLISLGLVLALWGGVLFYMASIFFDGYQIKLDFISVGDGAVGDVLIFIPGLFGMITLASSVAAMLYFHLIDID